MGCYYMIPPRARVVPLVKLGPDSPIAHLAAGTRVRKVGTLLGHFHQNGDQGVVKSAMGWATSMGTQLWGYEVLWDTQPWGPLMTLAENVEEVV